MAFQVSPGVQIREFDLTAIVPAVSTTPAAYCGVFGWGPADQRVLISTEKQLETIFRKPLNQAYYATSWMLPANFLSYGGNLQVVRNVKEVVNNVNADNDVNAISFVSFPGLYQPNGEGTQPSETPTLVEWRGINEGCFYAGTSTSWSDQASVMNFTTPGGGSFGLITGLVDTLLSESYFIDPLSIDGVSQDRLYFDADVSGVATKFARNIQIILQQINSIAIIDEIDYATTAGQVLIARYVPGGEENVPSKFKKWSEVSAFYSKVLDYANSYKSATATANITQVKNREHYEAITLGAPETVFDTAFVGKYPGDLLNGCGIVIYGSGYDPTVTSEWSDNYPNWAKETFGVFNTLPDTTDQAALLGFTGDEVHVAVVDITGKITGTKNTVIEYFESLSVAPDSKRPDGTSNYWLSVINNRSQYIWAGDIDSQITYTSGGIAWGTTFENTAPGPFVKIASTVEPNYVVALTLGQGNIAGINTYDSSDANLSSRILTQYETSFGDADESDISILIGYNTTIATDINDFVAIAENRKDCIAFVSACYDLDLIGGTRADIMDGITNYVDDVSSTSYGAMDSGYKYQYDRFNNVYRYVPLCADSAGCAVRTDNQKDPWWSPAGYDRGRVLNVVKLVFNPNKDERDVLYKKNVNPVITSQGFGVILFGDKTLQKKPSAFDRINVRRLFNVLEKSIATAAKFQLFEFNDAFTRSQFKQLVEPFLRDIQGRRGITSYAVVCDESNNTPSVVDANRFVADIFVAPNRSINFITLNFIATPTGVTFAEYGG
jgi:hypothetical protein